jgi:hypothetical protein
MSAELFRYRGAARDGGTLEYIFESDERDLPKTATKEQVAEIAADFMTTFYGIQVGTLETQDPRTANTVLAGLIFRHDQGSFEADVFCGPAAKRARGGAESSKAVVGSSARHL